MASNDRKKAVKAYTKKGGKKTEQERQMSRNPEQEIV
jgi:hypothetical protein